MAKNRHWGAGAVYIQVVLLVLVSLVEGSGAADTFTREDALAALRGSVEFYRTHVGYQGAYLYRYSADLTKQEGEHEAYRTTGWTQPPGAPTVGEAYLEAFLITGEPFLLDAAKECGDALLRGQLQSGGWDYKFELDPQHRSRYAYRVKPTNPNGRNYTSLDDNKTQSSVRFLMRLDAATEHRDSRLNEGVRYALSHLAAAQYPNGAWPQQFQKPPPADAHPVRKASYPEAWSRSYQKQDYRGHYTFNDNAIVDMIDVMLEAAAIYQEPAYRAAAVRAGDFIVLAQMPEPQPGWSQQYDRQMHPAWARKFEPPAITGGESQAVMRALLRLFDATGEKRFLAPLPSAIAYYRRSLLDDGRLARFYELRTNRPLYFTQEYVLTYKDDDLPTHYGFKVASGLDAIEREFQRLKTSGPRGQAKRWRPGKPKNSESLRRAAASAAAEADSRGAWVEQGTLRTYPETENASQVITMATFVRQLRTLSRYVAAATP